MDKGGDLPRSRKVRKKVLLTLLRDARRKADVRQVDLAKALGQPQSYVSKYESGERRLDLVELQDICNALKIPLTGLVRRFEKASVEADETSA